MSIKKMSQAWQTDCKTHTQKLVLLALADNSNDEGYCWPSIAALARKCGLSERGVQVNIQQLIQSGYVFKQTSVGRKSNQYSVLQPCTPCGVESNPTPHAIHPNPAPYSPQPRTACTLPPPTIYTLNRQLTVNEPSVNRKPKKKSGRAPRGTLAEVVAFCLEIHLPESDAIFFFNKWEGCGWINSDKPIKDWKATIRSWQAAGWVPSQKSGPRGTIPQPSVDTFWKDKARLDMVEKEISAIEARASHTAMDMIVETQDKDRYARLKAERKEIKAKMKL